MNGLICEPFWDFLMIMMGFVKDQQRIRMNRSREQRLEAEFNYD
jgi:hypothetical protein